MISINFIIVILILLIVNNRAYNGFKLSSTRSRSILSLSSSLKTLDIKTDVSTYNIEKNIGIDNINEIKEQAAIDFLRKIQLDQLKISSLNAKEPVSCSYVKISKEIDDDSNDNNGRVSSMNFFDNIFNSNKNRNPNRNPIVLIHGFDSSSLEYRRLGPLLAKKRDVYIPDILGWGFSDVTNVNDFSPSAKMLHLKTFIKDIALKNNKNGKVIIGGASLGGALAMILAVECPELVDKVVLIDAQGFIDGKGPSDIADNVATFGVNVLKSWPLRMLANLLSYKDLKFATFDAMRCGRLHCLLPSWEKASVNFLKSGGFVVSDKVPLVMQDTLVIWGRDDKILEANTPQLFKDTLPNLKEFYFIENCGHVPHLEKPNETTDKILSFLNDV